MRKILKTIMTLALLMAVPATMQAQSTVVVAEGTASPNVPPFYLYNAKYAQWSQSVYPASELTAIAGRTLTAFTYHTSISTFTPDPEPVSDQVAIEMPFDFPFGTQTIAGGTQLYVSAAKGLALTQSGYIFAPMSLTAENAAYEGIGDSTILTLVNSDSVVVEWNAVQHGTGTTGNTYTFQLVLEANGDITFHYNNCTVNSYKEIVQGVYCSAAENTCLNGYSYADPSRNHAGLSTRSISSSSKPRDGQIYRFQRPDCHVIAVSGSEPWTEEFNDLWVDGRLPGGCWESVQSHNGSSTNNHWSRSYNDHSGNSGYGAYMTATYSYNGSWNAVDLITPMFDIPEAEAYTVGFWMKRGTGSTVNAQTGVRLFASSSADTADGQLILFAPYFTTVNPTVAEAGWYYFEATIPTAGRQRFILRGVDCSTTRLDIDGIRVAAIPNCSHPADMAWDADNQQVTWTAGSATQWQVRDGATLTVVSTPAYSNSAWLPASNYNVYVRSICGAGDTLEWRGPVSFMTACDIITLDGSDSLVYDFDNLTTSGTIPACWTTSHISGPGSGLWGSYSAVSAHSGNRVMRLPDMDSTTITDLVTAQINIATANSYEVRLWIKRGNGTKRDEGVKVWVNTTPDTVGGTALFHARRCITAEPVVETEGWYEYRGTIPMAGNMYIVLQGISKWGQQTWIDDFVIAPATTAPVEPGDTTDNIQYWVGTGENSATFTLHFNNAVTPVSLVWGYRWDDPYDDYTVGMMMEEIAEADPRVSFDGLENGFLNGYSYIDSTYNLTAPTGSNYAGFIVNDEVANYGCNVQPLADGDAIAWMDADYDFFSGDINLGPTDTIYVTAPSGDMPDPQPVVRPFAAEDILYWVGSGDTGSVVVVSWDDESGDEVALAWGVRYERDSYPTVLDLLDSIQAADTRFSYSVRRYMGEVYDINTISYENENYSLAETNTSSIHVRVWGEEQTDDVVGDELETFSVWDGDLVQISTSGLFTAVTVIPVTVPAQPVEPTPVDASIAFEDILYWVGTGSDSAVFIVNYAQPDTAFAWGYLFNGTTTAETMANNIAAADPRLEISGSPSMGGDIRFALENGDTLGLSPVGELGYNFWWTNLNGVSADAGANSTIHNGDVFKYGDLNSAIGWDYMGGYFMQEAWEKVPTPVSVPDTTGHVGIYDANADFIFTVWPNPATMRVNVEAFRDAEAQLFDLAGRQVGKYKLVQGANTIDISGLANGVYILRAGGTVRKIVKRS